MVEEKTNTKTRKNIDYSGSAVKLCNPLEVQIDLRAYHGLTLQIEKLKADMDACVPEELKDKMMSLDTQLDACRQGVLADIDQYGSYQDINLGEYAVKQRKVSKSYKAEPFEKVYPQFTPAVIIKAVDITRLNGLIKGGLLDEARLEAEGILAITESFAYIIK